MSTEIKFQAFDKEFKQIWPVSWIDFEHHELIMATDFGGSLSRKFDEVMLMRFANLQDKNDVGVYEGNVLSPNNRLVMFGEYSGPFGMGTGFYTVAHSPDYDSEAYGLTSVQLLKSEVIGNIHENPELLEKVES